MFMSTRAAHRKDGRTQVTQTILRGIISDKHIISESSWMLALVRKKGTEHSFLLIEGQLDGERKLFRSDLFLAADNRPRIVESLASIDSTNVVEHLWGYSASSGHGTAFIRLIELNESEYDALLDRDTSEYQSWGIDKEEAEALLHYLIEEANKSCIPYHIAGDHPSWISSASTMYYHNCVSWCQEVIENVFEGRLEVGDRWALIKRPSDVVRQAQTASAVDPLVETESPTFRK